jgi:hypothetical protein
MALLTACVQCHLKPFGSGEFRHQLQDAFMELRLTIADNHPLLDELQFVLFDLGITETPDHNQAALWDLALDAGFLKSTAAAVASHTPGGLSASERPHRVFQTSGVC